MPPPFSRGRALWLTGLGAHGDEPVALVMGEACDMCLIFRKSQGALEPAVCLFLGQRPLLPEPVKCGVSLDALAPEGRVGEGPHRQTALFMGADIGVAHRVAGAGVVECAGIGSRITKQVPAVMQLI